MGADAAADEIAIETRGSRRSSRSTVRALNALNTGMPKAAAAYLRFARDPQIYAVAAVGEREGLAGGDVRELALGTRGYRDGTPRVRRGVLPQLAARCFSKPTISLINGPVMGSGVITSTAPIALLAAATGRHAGDRHRLFPDVGTAWRHRARQTWGCLA
jgi:enoyl-CoA hydratase